MFEVPATLKGDIESVGQLANASRSDRSYFHHIVGACEQATASRRAEGMAARTGGTRDSPDDDDACRVKASQRGCARTPPRPARGLQFCGKFCGLRFLVWDRQVVPLSREGVTTGDLSRAGT